MNEYHKVAKAAKKLLEQRDAFHRSLCASKEAGMPVTKLAILTGVAQGYMSDVIAGKKPISFNLVRQLAEMGEKQ